MEQLCAGAAEAEDVVDEPKAVEKRPVVMAPAGDPRVMGQLKAYLGVGLQPDDVATNEIGPDAFALRVDSPLAEAHELLAELYRA